VNPSVLAVGSYTIHRLKDNLILLKLVFGSLGSVL